MNLSQALSKFESMSIESLMDRAELMDRTDRKFVFHRRLLLDILDDCTAEYSILEMDAKRIFAYETEYFDTPERLLLPTPPGIGQSIQGQKTAIRWYG